MSPLSNKYHFQICVCHARLSSWCEPAILPRIVPGLLLSTDRSRQCLSCSEQSISGEPRPRVSLLSSAAFLRLPHWLEVTYRNLNGAGFPRIITNDDFDTEMSAIIYEENHWLVLLSLKKTYLLSRIYCYDTNILDIGNSVKLIVIKSFDGFPVCMSKDTFYLLALWHIFENGTCFFSYVPFSSSYISLNILSSSDLRLSRMKYTNNITLLSLKFSKHKELKIPHAPRMHQAG